MFFSVLEHLLIKFADLWSSFSQIFSNYQLFFHSANFIISDLLGICTLNHFLWACFIDLCQLRMIFVNQCQFLPEMKTLTRLNSDSEQKSPPTPNISNNAFTCCQKHLSFSSYSRSLNLNLLNKLPFNI